jgi:UDP-N-acetylglucosamine 4,6-dehydratase/5-epimerase
MRVFISGIAGSLGTGLASLHHSRGDQVWGCSRNESRAVEWLADHPRIATVYVTDARDLASWNTDCGRLLPSMDRLYHLAAQKHVDICEQQPFEACRQNLDLTMFVACACEQFAVPLVLASSDKACLPQGVYGASKLLAERIVLRHGGAVVRLGNIIGSSSSVFAFWQAAVTRGERIKLTDPEMTRYFLPLADAAAFMADRHVTGYVAIPDPLRAIAMGDVATAMAGDRVDIVGPRSGETQHQWLVAPGERIRQEKGRIILDSDGIVATKGLCSATAARWEIEKLLWEVRTEPVHA